MCCDSVIVHVLYAWDSASKVGVVMLRAYLKCVAGMTVSTEEPATTAQKSVPVVKHIW